MIAVVLGFAVASSQYIRALVHSFIVTSGQVLLRNWTTFTKRCAPVDKLFLY